MTYYASGTPSLYLTRVGEEEGMLQTGDGRCGAWAQLLKEALRVHGVSSTIYALSVPNNPIGLKGILVKNWIFGRHIRSGDDGERDSSVVGDTDQAITPGGQDQPCITPGSDGILQSTIETDDTYGDGVVQGQDYSYLIYDPEPPNKYGDLVPGEPLPAQGNSNPQQQFPNHAVIEYGGDYYDPSYGISAGTQGDYEDAAIDGLYYSWNARKIEDGLINWTSE